MSILFKGTALPKCCRDWLKIEGILIKDMQMPKSCRDCLMIECVPAAGSKWCVLADRRLSKNYEPIPYDGRPDWCPLVEFEKVEKPEIVTCKNCKYWHREIHNGIEYVNFSSCGLNHCGDGHNFYCADAERRTDD